MGDEIGGSERDILIELRADMKHVRDGVDRLKDSDAKQWDKIDAHGAQIAGHEKSIGFLGWGFRLLAGAIVTGIGGIFVYWATHPK